METITSIEHQKHQIIHEILYKLESEISSFLGEIQKSYALYKGGVKNDFIKQIEKIVDDPFDNLMNISNDIDSKMNFIIDNIINHFLKTKKDSIKAAYKLNTEGERRLYYLIVLNNDTIENRQDIFDFLDKFELTEIGTKFPVYFKFVNEELVPGYKIEKNVDL